MQPEMLRRQQALERLAGEFKGKACDFVAADCIRMVRSHLVTMGHAPPPLPPYRTLIGATRALRRAGYASVTALFDGLLPRIPVACMWPGDVAVLAGDGMEAAVVKEGLKFMGWQQDHAECCYLIPLRIEAAWRV